MKRIGILLATALVLASCAKKEVTNFRQGKIDRDVISITTKVPGRIAVLRVSEGDFVHQGDTLAILDAPEVDSKKAQALGAVESASAQYEMTKKGATDNQMAQLRAKESALQAQYNYAEKSLQRLKNMLADSLISQQKYDEVYVKSKGAKAQLDAVKAEIKDVENGVRKEQQGMAQGQQKRALGALQEVNVAESEKYIIAPTDMTIETITLKVGELALPGYTLVQGTLPGSTFFKFTVSEKELNQVKKGAKVSVHSVYSNRDIASKVTLVKKLPAYADIPTAFPDYELSQSLFEVIVKPENSDSTEDLLTGTTVLMHK